MFDTRLKFEEEEEEGKAISSNKDESEPELQVHRNGTQITSGGIQEISSSRPSDDNDGYISDVSTAVNSDCDASDDCSTSYDSEGESESDNDTDDGIYGGSFLHGSQSDSGSTQRRFCQDHYYSYQRRG